MAREIPSTDRVACITPRRARLDRSRSRPGFPLSAGIISWRELRLGQFTVLAGTASIGPAACVDGKPDQFVPGITSRHRVRPHNTHALYGKKLGPYSAIHMISRM